MQVHQEPQGWETGVSFDSSAPQSFTAVSLLAKQLLASWASQTP